MGRAMRPPQDHTTEFPFPETIVFRPIGVMRSPYKERCATPHQPTTVRGTRGHTAAFATFSAPEVAAAAAPGFADSSAFSMRST